ncbi:MAG: tetratricopeptide repeat protein [Deltaproteobacteria bacterium]|jgi:tol-pal system protein YbgF|nr:tetratricopeptide repeat protein [Deltaproteobacteria bacterium]
MATSKTLSLFSFLALFVFSACNGGGGVSIGNSSLEREVNVLRQEVADLKDKARLDEMTPTGQAGIAVRQELDGMRTSIQRINESIETASLGGLTIRQQLEFRSARLDRLENKAGLTPLSPDLVTPTAGVPAGATAGVPVVPAPTATTPAATGPVAVPAPAAATTSAPPSLYDQGKARFDQKNYPQALSLLRQYLAAEPKGSQAASAQFYVGECLYYQNQFEDAILEYQVLVSGWPKNTLVSTALLKQGLAFQATGDAASAKILYQKVVREFPKSYAAGVAQERLKTM